MLQLGLLLTCWGAMALPAGPAPEPYFIVLPGIEGMSPCPRGVVSGLRQTHPNATYEIFDWTTGHAYRMFYHARAWTRHQQIAGELAQRILALQTDQPYRPIILIGHSGGAAMAIVALEQLPPGYRVHQVILLAPDLAPSYPLGTALDRTVYGIDVFHSRFDCLMLGAGTTLLGTIERVHTPAAGMLGFHTPGCLDEGTQFLYCMKLRQHGYEPAMALTGYVGGHFTCTTPEFVNRYVSPVIR
jgi:pimeloyl-ACP methyl ester carboxylesterase